MGTGVECVRLGLKQTLLLHGKPTGYGKNIAAHPPHYCSDRWILQPWIADETGPASERIAAAPQAAQASPLRRHLGELLDLLGEAALVRTIAGYAAVVAGSSHSIQSIRAPTPDSVEPGSALALSALVVYALADPAL